MLGRRIAEEHLDEDGHAEYGKQVIMALSKQLTAEYGAGFDASNLYKFLRFYRDFPILDTLCPKSGNLLSWSHYRALQQLNDSAEREWYLNEAAEQTWSVRTLQRNISSQYYRRMLMSQHKEIVEKEMLEITRPVALANQGQLAVPERITVRSVAGEKFDRITRWVLKERPGREPGDDSDEISSSPGVPDESTADDSDEIPF